MDDDSVKEISTFEEKRTSSPGPRDQAIILVISETLLFAMLVFQMSLMYKRTNYRKVFSGL